MSRRSRVGIPAPPLAPHSFFSFLPFSSNARSYSSESCRIFPPLCSVASSLCIALGQPCLCSSRYGADLNTLKNAETQGRHKNHSIVHLFFVVEMNLQITNEKFKPLVSFEGQWKAQDTETTKYAGGATQPKYGTRQPSQKQKMLTYTTTRVTTYSRKTRSYPVYSDSGLLFRLS